MSVQGGGFRGRLRARSAGKVLAAGIAVVLGFGPAAADRLLFIGNSYLQDGGGVHVHAAALASSAAPERRIEVAASTVRGSRLDEQDISATLARAPYDTVVLQGHSTAALTEAARERFRTAVRRAHREIAAKGGQTVLYMTPAYSAAHPRHEPEMFSRISEEYTTLGREIGAAVIPVGLAYEIAYARRPDIGLHQPDGSHATARGIYLAAATTAAALFDIDPTAAAYAMDGAIPREDAAFLRTVAADAVGRAQGCGGRGPLAESAPARGARIPADDIVASGRC
ncbi:MAG: hypothetical protein NXH97_00425 [Rhodobacteraceae bacterium]|nr:hypothetical protein [Paracoccaceae bacterium]